MAVSELPENVVVSKLDELASWCRKNSLWPMPLGLSCCGIELMAMIGPKFDISRFGAEAALATRLATFTRFSDEDRRRIEVFAHAELTEAIKSLRADGVAGEMQVREVREGRAEVVQMWGRPESVREEFRQRRAL